MDLSDRAREALQPIAQQSKIAPDNIGFDDETDDLASVFQLFANASALARVTFYSVFLLGVAIVFCCT